MSGFWFLLKGNLSANSFGFEKFSQNVRFLVSVKKGKLSRNILRLAYGEKE